MERKRVFEGIIVTAVILFALYVCGWMVYDGISTARQNESLVGREVVIGYDTVRVTGYNASVGAHILSNGLLMDREYVRANAPKITPIKAQIDTNTLKVFREMGYQITKIDTTRYGLNP
jgi:hypothetical protein